MQVQIPPNNDQSRDDSCDGDNFIEQDDNQTWGQLLSNVIDYITITLQFS